MDMTDPYACVTLDDAAILLGSANKPFSRTTIQRMIRDGVLEARGSGRLRRVTLASINEYRTGVRTWHGDERAARGAHTRTSTANGGRKSRPETDEHGGRVRLVGKTPTRNLKRS